MIFKFSLFQFLKLHRNEEICIKRCVNDCPAGYACHDGFCRKTCKLQNSDMECPQHETCDRLVEEVFLLQIQSK